MLTTYIRVTGIRESFRFQKKSVEKFENDLGKICITGVRASTMTSLQKVVEALVKGCQHTVHQSSMSTTSTGSNLVSVKDFGAVGDGVTDDTEAFEQAIRQIESFGSGRLIVTGGNYLIRPINLTSHMTMLLTANVRIMGVADKDTWPLIPGAPSYGQGRDHPGPRYTSLLHGEQLQNVTIRGQGNTSVLDGQGAYWWNMRRNKLDQYTRGSLVEFMYSQDIAMYDLTMVSS